MSATQQILAHMRMGYPVTGRNALAFYGCYRLSDVIWKLRRRGHLIHTQMRGSGKKTYAEYRLL